MKKKGGLARALATTLTVLLAMIVIGSAVYLNDYYRADLDAIHLFQEEAATPAIAAGDDGGQISIQIMDNGNMVFRPDEVEAGIIFYPGGKVEYEAYIPLMEQLAEEGNLCVLVKMPFRLAVLKQDAADGIREAFPEIDHWYMGGHSLGGAMAALYAEKNQDKFDGLILLGAYSTKDLSHTNLKVLSIYGSEDHVMNHEKYEAGRINLPSDYSEVVVPGGCHAYFGMYGPQEGDGEPTISNADQIRITARSVAEFQKGLQ